MKSKYYFEMTDTFGGEKNYCWLHRFTIEAKSIRGALQKLSRETGFNFRFNGMDYSARNACVAAYELGHEVNQDWVNRSKKL